MITSVTLCELSTFPAQTATSSVGASRDSGGTMALMGLRQP